MDHRLSASPADAERGQGLVELGQVTPIQPVRTQLHPDGSRGQTLALFAIMLPVMLAFRRVSSLL